MFDFVSTKPIIQLHCEALKKEYGGQQLGVKICSAAVQMSEKAQFDWTSLYWLYNFPPALYRTNNTCSSRLLNHPILHIWHEALYSSLLPFFPSQISARTVAAVSCFLLKLHFTRVWPKTVTFFLYFYKCGAQCIEYPSQLDPRSLHNHILWPSFVPYHSISTPMHWQQRYRNEATGTAMLCVVCFQLHWTQ